MELHYTVARAPDWDDRKGAFKVELADARGNVGLWLLRDFAMKW